jgi:two-component system NtrC family sensor kinase
MNTPESRQPYQRYYQRLKYTIFLLMLLVVCIPLSIVAGTIYNYYQTYVRTTVEQNLKGVVEKRRTAIEVFLAERVAYLQTLANINCLTSGHRPKGIWNLFAVINQVSDSFVDLGIITEDGKQTAYVGPYDLKGRNYFGVEWFKQVSQNGLYISDVFMGYRNVPHLAIGVRGSDSKAPPAWFLRATINTETFKRLMKSGILGATRDAYLYKYDCSLQLHQGKSLPIDTSTMQLPDYGKVSVGQVSTVDNHTMLTAIGWLNQNRWLLVVAEDPTSEFVSLFHARRVGLYLFFIAIAVVGVVAFYTSHWIVRKIHLADNQRDMIQEHMSRTSRLVSLGKMAAGLAHEINNPLAIISESAGYAKEVMDMADEKGLPLSAEQRQEIYTVFEDIVSESFRGKEITQRLLGFARGVDAKIVEVDLNKMAGDLIKYYARILTKAGKVKVMHQFDRNMPTIRTDPSQVQQVLINLIDNAIHFSSQNGGTVTVITEAYKNYVKIMVNDNGPGIPENIKERLFDPFFTTKPVGQGTGLGLAICYGIAKKLGGEIYADSVEGVSTTFTIQLPMIPPSKEMKK